MLLFTGVFLVLFLSGCWQLLCAGAMLLVGRLMYDLFVLFKTRVREKTVSEKKGE